MLLAQKQQQTQSARNPGTQIAPNQNQSISTNPSKIETEYFTRHIKGQLERISKLACSDRDVILFFGKSGSGTSTFINYLENIEIFSYSNDTQKLFIDSVKPVTKIRADNSQETTFPVRVEDKTNKLVYWDCGGFPDIKKPSEEVPYLSVLKKIIKQSNRLKIVLTISWEDFDKKPEELFSSIDFLRKTFSEVQLLTSSLFLVITKAPLSKNSLSFKNKLSDLSLRKSLLPDIKKVLESISKNYNFGVFYAPENTGRIDQESKFQTLKKLQEMPYFLKDKIRLKISDQSNELIKMIAEEAFQGFDLQIKGLVEAIEEIIQGTLVDGKAYNRLKGLEKSLTSIFESSDLMEFAQGVSDLASRENFGEVEIRNFGEEIKFALNLLQVSQVITLETDPWYAKIESLVQEIGGILKNENMRVDGVLIIKGFFVTSSGISQLYRLHRRDVEVYAYSAFIIDGNVKLINNNIVIVAPQWIVQGEKKFTIDLSGQDGAHAGLARIKDGEPGLPGWNGGNMLGIGSKFIGMKNLTIKTNGGNGGHGGQGKDGDNGINGTNGSGFLVETFDSSVLKSSVLTNATTLGFKKTYLEIYESKGTMGKNGTDGGKGGRGGHGGYPGEVKLIGAAASDWPVIEKQIGREGEDGIGGRAGKGGLGGLSYCGERVSERFMGVSRSDNCYWKTSPFSYREKNGLDGKVFVVEKNHNGIRIPKMKKFDLHEEAARQQYSTFVEEKRALGFRFLSVKI